MQWVIENWLLVLVGVGLTGMHLSGHRHGHGGKKCPEHGLSDDTKKRDQNNSDQTGGNTDA